MSGQHHSDTIIPWADSQRLRAIRRTLGWTQLELSLHLGVSDRTIWAIECGELRGRRVYIQEVVSYFLNKHKQI